ncbi:MAG TPA: DUF4177 domain-containing protein [Terriglobales bacterium]|nr:DUF4177 domain-containing protein [Terriglobales bacterium]
MKRFVLAAFFLGLFLGLMFARLAANTGTVSAAGVIEYKVVLADDFNPGFENHLNQYGKDGWELITITQPQSRQHLLIFRKR